MRILHCAGIQKPSSGIVQQMLYEKQAADSLNIPWDVKLFCSKESGVDTAIAHYCDKISILNTEIKILNWAIFRFLYYKWLFTQKNNYDVILLRYYVHDPFQLMFILLCGKPVYFVHHTMEIEELSLGSKGWGWVRSRLEKIIGKLCLQCTSGLVGVTEEIAEYEHARSGYRAIKRMVYSNGTILKDKVIERIETEKVEILFVASYFADWQGLDRLLEHVRKSNGSFKLHIVGKVSENDKKKAEADSRVVFHGSLSEAEIETLSRKCSVGLACFALDRKGMKQACPLKVRQYLQLGLAAYADCGDVFSETFTFYKQGKPDMALILDYADSIRGVPKVRIAEDAKPYIDKVTLLSALYKELGGCVSLSASKH